MTDVEANGPEDAPTPTAKDYVCVRSHGEEVEVGVGRRTPADADWYRALVCNVAIRPEDARRVGEKAIRAAFLRRVRAERKIVEAAARIAGEPHGGE